MTEAEWLGCGEVPRQLLVIQDYAPVRKLRLIAAAFVRHLQQLPDYDEAKCCDDLIEAVADQPRPWEQVMDELWVRPGNWRHCHILRPDEEQVVKELRKFAAFAPAGTYGYMVELILEVVGNPFRPVAFDPAWRTDTAVSLARQMYDARDFGAMPILADALQDAGCDHPDVLGHCRGAGPHVRGCWVVDLVLGKS